MSVVGLNERTETVPNVVFCEGDETTSVLLFSAALNYAKCEMPKKTWQQCCQYAVDTAAERIGISGCSCSGTLMRWYEEFKILRLFPVSPDTRRLLDESIMPRHSNREFESDYSSAGRK